MNNLQKNYLKSAAIGTGKPLKQQSSKKKEYSLLKDFAAWQRRASAQITQQQNNGNNVKPGCNFTIHKVGGDTTGTEDDMDEGVHSMKINICNTNQSQLSGHKLVIESNEGDLS